MRSPNGLRFVLGCVAVRLILIGYLTGGWFCLWDFGDSLFHYSLSRFFIFYMRETLPGFDLYWAASRNEFHEWNAIIEVEIGFK